MQHASNIFEQWVLSPRHIFQNGLVTGPGRNPHVLLYLRGSVPLSNIFSLSWPTPVVTFPIVAL